MSRSAVRDAVSSCLKAVLCASSELERRAAEQEMKALEVTEEYGAVLAELTAAKDVDVPYRQLASVLLRQYLDCHWCRHGDRFIEPIPTDQVKAEIRHILLDSIGDRERKLRTTIAYGVAVIAHWDWPDEWPELIPRLESALISGEEYIVHGAMRVLSEFCRDISDLQVPHVAPVILPQLLRVLLQHQVYNVRTLSKAIHIFHTISSITYTASETTPTLITSLLTPVLPEFVQAILYLLSCGHMWATDHVLRRELIMTSLSLLRWFPDVMATYVMDLVTSVWKIFLTNTPLYVVNVVNCHDDTNNDECDSDGELVSMETCVFAVFEFISGLVESQSLCNLLPPILSTLILHLITYMQLTHHQVTCWMEDVGQFVEEEEQEYSYSVRLSALDILQTMWEEPSLKDHTHSAITAAVEKQLQICRTSPSPHAWKVQEACLLALSCIVMTTDSRFSAQQFTETVVMPTLISPSAHPLLLGRCLWLAGKMAAHIKPYTLQQLLQSLVSGLHPSQHNTLRILAAKSAYYFCSILREVGNISSLISVLPSLLSLLINMTTNLPDIVLLVVIDTLQLVARVDDIITAQQVESLSQVSIALLLKYYNDPGVSSTLDDLISVLATNTSCHANFHQHFLPLAVQLLDSTNKEGLPLGLVAAVLDVIVHVVRGCGERDVPREIVHEIFPRVVHVAMASDDTALLQNAGECVRAFVAMAMEQLVQWVDSEGESGVNYVVRLAVYLLDPNRLEYSAAFIGRFIIVFIKKVGGVLGDNLQLLLRSVLSKMQSVKTASVMQSLLMIYTYLIHNELEAMVSFLSQVPDQHGQPALHYILREWTSQHPFFFGIFETRLSTMALCDLLRHCVATGDQILCGLTLHEDIISDMSGVGVVTRSQRSTAVSPQRSKVILPVKILHLLVSDLRSYLEVATASEGTETDDDDDDDGYKVREMEALLRSEEGQMEQEDIEDDPDINNDPILQLDIQAHLVQYLQELSQLSFFTSLLRPHLRADELSILLAVGIHV